MILTITLSIQACNIFSAVDKPSTDAEIYSRAITRADQKECKEAVDLLTTIPQQERPDKYQIALGWAYLCLGGATTKNVATSLYNYSSASGSLSVLGTLGSNLGDVTATKQAYIDLAISAFAYIENNTIRNVEVAIGKMVKAASILGLQATLNGRSHLEKSFISDVTTCDAVASDCLAGCAATASGTMSDASVTEFTTTINEAVTYLGSTSAAELGSLATAIKNKVAGATNIARCYIFKEIVP